MDSGYQQHTRQQAPSLFVGGLAFAATEQDLRDTFSTCGDINSCRIVTDRETGRSKGFAFVEFANEESLNRAIRELNGAMICGRPVRLDAGGKGKGKGGKGGFDQGRSGGQGEYREQSNFGGYQAGAGGYQSQGGYGQRQSYGEERRDAYHSHGDRAGYQPRQDSGDRQSYQPQGDRQGFQTRQDDRPSYQSQGERSGYQPRHDDRPSYGGYNRTQESSSYGKPQETSSYGGYGRQQETSSYGGYGRQQETSSYGGYGRDSRQERPRERSRSRSPSSSTKERRQRERHARKEQFAKATQGWDRRPTAEEIATQEAEIAAVRAAEAQGKDITTIRADFLKQSYASYN